MDSKEEAMQVQTNQQLEEGDRSPPSLPASSSDTNGCENRPQSPAPTGGGSAPPAVSAAEAVAPVLPYTDAEMAQMVCGSCRTLLSYPEGSTHVYCSSCRTVNFVLNGDEVGLVNCGKCEILLMYPHPSPSVRCSSCHFITNIGAHNRRPPWSVIQGHPQNPI